MLQRQTGDLDDQRRQDILRAALECFLQFGYGKTSLDDIAKRAGISRPLIYRKFKNKEEIFAGVFEELFNERYPLIEQVLAGSGSRRQKLLRVYEILVIEPWDLMSKSPLASEFYEACTRILPAVEEKHERQQLKYTQAILETRELSELFVLAVYGLETDMPRTSVLRRRLQLLVEQFVGA